MTTLKRRVVVFIAAFILLTFSSCHLPINKFSGSRSGNDNHLWMEYSVLNTTDSQLLDLRKGDLLDCSIVSKSGKVNISLQDENGASIFQGTAVFGTFQLIIPKTGLYTVYVTGEHAKGSVSIVNIE